MVELVLGGTASGKSAFALSRLLSLPGSAVMVTTGRAYDLGFRQQIEAHRRSRPDSLRVVECRHNLADLLESLHGTSVLVDSLDFWAFAAMQDGRLSQEADALMDVVHRWNQGLLLVVSQEMGLAPLALDPAVRHLVRFLGGLHQRLAALCRHVYLVVAGLPHLLK